MGPNSCVKSLNPSHKLESPSLLDSFKGVFPENFTQKVWGSCHTCAPDSSDIVIFFLLLRHGQIITWCLFTHPKSISISVAVIPTELFVWLKTVLVSRTHENIYTNQTEWKLKDDNGYNLPRLTSGKLCKFMCIQKLNSLICFCWFLIPELFIFLLNSNETQKNVLVISEKEKEVMDVLYECQHVLRCVLSAAFENSSQFLAWSIWLYCHLLHCDTSWDRSVKCVWRSRCPRVEPWRTPRIKTARF